MALRNTELLFCKLNGRDQRKAIWYNKLGCDNHIVKEFHNYSSKLSFFKLKHCGGCY